MANQKVGRKELFTLIDDENLNLTREMGDSKEERQQVSFCCCLTIKKPLNKSFCELILHLLRQWISTHILNMKEMGDISCWLFLWLTNKICINCSCFEYQWVSSRVSFRKKVYLHFLRVSFDFFLWPRTLFFRLILRKIIGD